MSYLDAVEEAGVCSGGLTASRSDSQRTNVPSGLRPASQGANWTELNKRRARRLIRLGLMTDAGRATLPI